MTKKLLVILIVAFAGIWGTLGFLSWQERQEKGIPKEKEHIEFTEIEIKNSPFFVKEAIWIENGEKIVILAEGAVGLVDLEKKSYKDLYKIPKPTGSWYLTDLSSDRNQSLFIFTERNFDGDYKIHLLSLEANSHKVIRESEQPFWDAIISGNGAFIFYKIYEREKGHRPRLITISTGEEEDLANYLPTGLYKWQIISESDELIYAAPIYKKEEEITNYEFKSFNIETKESQSLFSIISAWHGMSNFKVTPDGNYLFFDSVSIDGSGRHLWMYDFQKDQKLQLTNIEGEEIQIDYLGYSENNFVGLRFRHLAREKDLIMFSIPKTNEQKIYQLASKTHFLGDWQFSGGMIPKNGLWISRQKKVKFLAFTLENLSLRLYEVDPTQFLSQKQFFQEKEQEAKFKNYENRNLGISFQYPSFFGEIRTKDYDDFQCLRFSKVEGSGHIRITSITGLQDFASSRAQEFSQKFIEMFQKTEQESDKFQYQLWFQQEPCPYGLFGFLSLLTSADEFGEGLDNGHWFSTETFPEFKFALKYLSLIDAPESYLENIAYILFTPFIEGWSRIEDVEFVSNKDKSLVGIGFLTTEGFDTSATTFYESILTFPEEGEKMILIKIPLVTSEMDHHLRVRLGVEGAKKTWKTLWGVSQEGAKIITNSTELTSAPEAVSKLSFEEKRIAKFDLRYKIDLWGLASVLEDYRGKYHQYPIVEERERITRDNLEQSKLYQTFGNIHYVYHSPWDFYLEGGDFYEYWSDGKTYELTAFLRDKSDPECVIEQDRCIYKIRKSILKEEEITPALKDGIIITAMNQIRNIMTYIYGIYGNYDNLDCSHLDMVDLCTEINNNGGKMNIVRDSITNSQKVCVYSSLNEPNYWYCADSRRETGYAEIDPGSNDYCVQGGEIVCPSIE